MAIRDDLKTVGYVALGGFVLWKLLGDRIMAKLNPFSDQNLAYQGADALAKAAMGKDATLTDFIPGINKTNATTTPTSARLRALSVLPNKDAPYWFDKAGNKRMAPMPRAGTVYNRYGQAMQITDAASQAAAYHTSLSDVE